MKKLFFLVIVTFLSSIAYTQSTEQFSLQLSQPNQVTYNHTKYHLNNGDYIVSIHTYDSITSELFNYLISFNNNNQINWQKELQYTNQWYNHPQSLTDGSNIYPIILNTTDNSLAISKINSGGNAEWTRRVVPNSPYSQFIEAVCNDNALYFVIQYADVNSVVYHNIIKMDSNGNIEWSKEISASANKNPVYDVSAHPGGGIIASGKRNSDMYMFSINPDGSKRWVNCYYENETYYTQLWKIVSFNSGNKSLVSGYRVNITSSEVNYFYAIADNLGQIESMFNFDTLYGQMIEIIAQNDIVTIVSISYNTTDNYINLLDINEQGEIIRARQHNMGYNDLTNYYIDQTGYFTYLFGSYDAQWNPINGTNIGRSDASLNSCIVFNDLPVFNHDLDYSAPYVHDSSSYLSISSNVLPGTINLIPANITKQTLCLSQVGLDPNETVGINIYPNPCTDKFYIESDNTPEKLEVFNSEGKLMLTHINPGIQGTDISSLSPGLYFVRIKSGNSFSVKKLIKVKA